MGQVYTGAYTEGIEEYFLTLLGLTCGADTVPQGNTRGKMGGKGHQAVMCRGGEQPQAGWGMGSGRPSPPGRQPCSGLAVNLL